MNHTIRRSAATVFAAITAFAVTLLGTAGSALAGPVPVHEGGTTGNGLPPSSLQDGTDWTPWVLGAIAVVVLASLAWLLVITPRRNPRRPAHA